MASQRGVGAVLGDEDREQLAQRRQARAGVEVDAVLAFVADTSPDKRNNLVDDLLARAFPLQAVGAR